MVWKLGSDALEERRQSNDILAILECIELAVSWTPKAMKKAA